MHTLVSREPAVPAQWQRKTAGSGAGRGYKFAPSNRAHDGHPDGSAARPPGEPPAPERRPVRGAPAEQRGGRRAGAKIGPNFGLKLTEIDLEMV